MNKKILSMASIFLLTFSSLSFAYPAFYPNHNYNFYAGGQLGLADTHERNCPLTPEGARVNDTGLAGRLFFGMNISPNFAVELGMAHYGNTTIRTDYSELEFSQFSVDIQGKISIPVNPQFSIYGKAGIAGVHQYDFRAASDYDEVYLDGEDIYSRPIAGVGFNYNLDKKIALDVGAYHIFGERYLSDIDFIGAGLSFKFG